jgi:DNA-binding phage protein
MMKDRSHDEAMSELFRDDPQFAAEYLNGVLEDGVSLLSCWWRCVKLPMHVVEFAA